MENKNKSTVKECDWQRGKKLRDEEQQESTKNKNKKGNKEGQRYGK